MAANAIRNRFFELCEYIKTNTTLLKIRNSQFESEITDLTVEPGGHNESIKGWHFANFKYRGTIYIERMPGESLSLLMALIRAWLDEFDDLRDKYKLADPKVETINENNKLLTVMGAIEFVDDVYLVEDENGPIRWFGKNYTTGEYPYNVAEDGNANGAPLNTDD